MLGVEDNAVRICYNSLIVGCGSRVLVGLLYRQGKSVMVVVMCGPGGIRGN